MAPQPPQRQPRPRKEAVTLPVWIPFTLLFLCLLAVAIFTINPVETAREFARFSEWEPRAQRAVAAALILPVIALIGLLFKRILIIRPGGSAWTPPPQRKLGERVSLGVFLGSGGHTAEMRALMQGVDRRRYSPRVYVYCHGDEMSLRAVADIEGGEEKQGKAGGYSLVALPRARKVGQGRISSVFSVLRTAVHVLLHTFLLPLADAPLSPWVDVLIVNGPGTAVVLVAVAYIRRIFGLPHTRIVYVESFARVRSLSLSGKILRSFVDTFVVQWPQAAGDELLAIDEDVVETPKGISDEPTQEELRRVLDEKETGCVYRGWLV
ncbi:Alg14-domain-containing protein [Cutaneotrichosporon oleaginosum]|uniref:UDP-N-acetylglucosamine transferase subunit ALG14 n=1 Tax=Cutaneotrichosporon oleaginosum TaxID=879819 RepID=A0A0J0XSP6_9TREE|nr:Alg14-domain-containing protein [Cutaneotrichosporon oleaginosum]KLT44126.1 Alg14-domain-containing protein [Cutaneotrichosporon oleaginosum]TXT09419.1 hypothetical protein COLE_03353 [Cutaneotrichosporon oleaginosum]